MARKGGNPDIGKTIKASLPPGVTTPRTDLFQLRVDSSLKARLRAFTTEELRVAMAEMADRLEGK